jgi:tetratricopeptide (TPR) repeat protein
MNLVVAEMSNERSSDNVIELGTRAEIKFAVFVLALLLALILPALRPAPASAQSLVYESAVQAFDAGDYEGALLMLDSLLRQYPTDIPALELQARAFAKQGYSEAAKAGYRLAFDLLLMRLDGLVTKSAVPNAEIIDPNPIVIPLMRVSAELALISLEGGDKAEFLYYAQLAYRFRTTDARVLEALADSYQKYRNYRLALMVMDYAVNACGEPNGENDISLAELHHLRGSMLYYIDQFGMAIVEYETAEKMGLTTPELYGNWAITLEKLELWQDALDMWTKLSKMDVPAEYVSMVTEHLILCKEKLGA